MHAAHTLHDTILREYDIRGVVGETLSEEDAFFIGKAFATEVKRRGKGTTITLGYDGRTSSPAFKAKVSEGMQSAGATVLDIGQCPTPMLYFSVYHFEASAGIMVTGSHNPGTHNGFKMMLADGESFFGKDIQKLGEMIASGDFEEGNGSEKDSPAFEDYLEELNDAYDAFIERKTLKVVWDAGNGAAGPVVARLCEELPGTHIPLYTEVDGSFPNHHPDPTVEDNLEDLKQAVQEHGCDLGVAFDGDGDRLGVVDNKGRVVWGDQLLMLFAFDVLLTNPGATIIADVKASETLFDKIKKAGGEPLMWKTGHSLIKQKMRQTNSPLAGEMSGHIFFHDEYYGFDDGIYAALRLLRFLSFQDESFSEIVDMLPEAHSTPEMRIPCDDHKKFTVVSDIKHKLKHAGATVNDIDGVRVTVPHGWWLVRASNTQPALVARCEANTPEQLEAVQKEMARYLKEAMGT